MNIDHNKEIESPKLRADILEPILTSCIKGESIRGILYKNQKLASLNINIIKKYLFFLIEFGLISYSGQKQIFVIEERGLDLLNIIEEEKVNEKTDMKNIIITF